MKKVMLIGLAMVLCVMGLFYVFAEDDGDDGDENEVAVAIDSLPAAVKSAVDDFFGDSAVLEAIMEEEHGVTVYEIEDTAANKEIKLSVEGELIEMEENISPEALPAAILAKLAGAEILKAESVTLFLYEVEIQKNGKVRELLLDASGARVEFEDDDDDDNDEDEDEEEIEWSQVPTVVQNAITIFADGGEIDDIVVEDEDGKLVYEFEVEKGDKEFEVEVDAEGNIIEVEEDEEDDDDDDK